MSRFPSHGNSIPLMNSNPTLICSTPDSISSYEILISLPRPIRESGCFWFCLLWAQVQAELFLGGILSPQPSFPHRIIPRYSICSDICRSVASNFRPFILGSEGQRHWHVIIRFVQVAYGSVNHQTLY